MTTDVASRNPIFGDADVAPGEVVANPRRNRRVLSVLVELWTVNAEG